MALFKKNKDSKDKNAIKEEATSTRPPSSDVENKSNNTSDNISSKNLKNLSDEEIKATQLNNSGKTDVNASKQVDSDKDVAKSKNVNLTKQLYKYWVYLYKDDKPVNNFGVIEDEYAGVKLLVRKIEDKGEQKVIFRELYPESAFDINWVKNNSKKIKDDLNKFKQIERKLLDNMYSKNPKKYTYDLSEVRLLIQEKQIMLDSIRFGVTTSYFRYFRDDGIPALEYDIENNGLRLRKYVKERGVYTEASESKKIESEHSRKQIDHSLKKKNDRDWQKIATMFIWVLLLGIASYGLWELMSYNAEREFAETENRFNQITETNIRNFEQLYEKVDERLVEREPNQIDELIQQNQILIDRLVDDEVTTAQR